MRFIEIQTNCHDFNTVEIPKNPANREYTYISRIGIYFAITYMVYDYLVGFVRKLNKTRNTLITY